MRIPSAVELLAVWERGLPLIPVQRGLLLLTALFPGDNVADLAGWSLGRRDAHLFTLREQLFGSQLDCLSVCPQCSEQLELTVAVPDLRMQANEPAGEDSASEVQAAGYTWRCRPPTSADVLAVISIAEAGERRQALLGRCILPDDATGRPPPDRLPDAATQALVAGMAQADAQADVQLALVCPSCGHPWSVRFDILAYLWSEISHWAQRTLREIHTLASAYGWTEAVILGMSAQRRQFYLHLVAGLD